MPRVTSACGNCGLSKEEIYAFYCNNCQSALADFENGWDETSNRFDNQEYRRQKEEILQGLRTTHTRSTTTPSTYERGDMFVIDPHGSRPYIPQERTK